MRTPLLHAAALVLQAGEPKPGDTEIWAPTPPVVAQMPWKAAPPPRGAIVLFDGRDLSAWRSSRDGGPAGWTVHDGILTVAGASGNIETRRRFGSYRLHLEWRVPAWVGGTGQGRGNSGVFLASTGAGDAGYELQILDGHRNPTYVNGQVGSLYKQHAPLANPSRPPGEWQCYDIEWTAPRFAADGRVVRPASVSVLMNGVPVQKDAVLRGPTVYVGTPRYAAHGRAAIKLQDHGAPVDFRNIWLTPADPR